MLSGLRFTPFMSVATLNRQTDFIYCGLVAQTVTVRFEPTVHFCITDFQDQLLKPLGHVTIWVWWDLNPTTSELKVPHSATELHTLMYRKGHDPPTYQL